MVPNKAWLIRVASDMIRIKEKQDEVTNAIQDLYRSRNLAKWESDIYE
jgi:hypothetical protein